MRKLFVPAVALASLSLVAAPASASATYHGTFGGLVAYQGCTAGPTEASGTWNVALRGGTDASVSIDIFTNDAHHVSFGGVVPQLPARHGDVFSLQFDTLAGQLTITLADSGSLSYQIKPYDYDGLSCASVTYFGTLGR